MNKKFLESPNLKSYFTRLIFLKKGSPKKARKIVLIFLPLGKIFCENPNKQKKIIACSISFPTESALMGLFQVFACKK